MKIEEKRIFISDLPETATPTEIEKAFKNYGNIISIEVKERKELGPKNNSLFFAYINIEIDDRRLQQCFKDFSNEKWLGRYVLLQIARESFLDRLKRERASTSNSNNVSSLEKVLEEPQQTLRKNISNGVKKEVKRKYKSSTESDSSDTDSSKRKDKIEPIETQNIVTNEKKVKSSNIEIKDEISTDINETLHLVIKNNKGKVINKNGLKIESVGNKPIIKIDKSKKGPVNSSEANLKRLQSLNNMKKGYQNQKALIQAALSKIDTTSNTKIIFDENIGNTSFKKSNKLDKQSRSVNLFDEDPDEDEFEADFSLKEQYQGVEGQKLLELQSKYKNDKRFILDERFLDKSEISSGKDNNEEVNEEMSLEEEKKKEYEILEQILGKKISPKFLHQKESQSHMKSMLRFDPTQPEHSKFEIKKEQGNQKKRKKQDSEVEILNKKNQDEKEMPAVSKEIFYKVTDNLKENLHVEQEFSLLSMFGQKDERGEQISEESSKPVGSNTKSALMGKNPFRYDSSDDEGETDNIPNKDQQEEEKSIKPVHTNTNRSNFWSEPFFFNNDDYKFQDGFDFIEKMKSEDKNEFTKLRKDLKDIVKTKVRNNQRKHKPFKKKLGGSKRKKMIKMKKALKR